MPSLSRVLNLILYSETSNLYTYNTTITAKLGVISLKIKARAIWKEYKPFLIFVVLMVIFRSAFADWNAVPTGSMKPTIMEGDRIYVNKMAYDFRLPLTHISLYTRHDPKRGDIIIFESEAAQNRLVKRVVGLPGDTIELFNNELIINGQKSDYSDVAYIGNAMYAKESFVGFEHTIQLTPGSLNHLSTFGPVTVPDDHYFVLGDNRDNSADSRVHGFVPRNEITGKAEKVVISLDYENYYLPRPHRYFEELH